MKLVAVVCGSANGQTLCRATETLTNLNFLGRTAGVTASDSLVHRKRLLDGWFRS